MATNANNAIAKFISKTPLYNAPRDPINAHPIYVVRIYKEKKRTRIYRLRMQKRKEQEKNESQR